MDRHHLYMQRCIILAQKGLGIARPNPSVGCVIVHQNKIIGEGFTSAYGGAHAEVNAIKSVKNKKLLSQSILYVTLEPCSHFGKTPPCSDLIIQYNIPKVMIGCKDPHEKVSGKGIEKLKSNGIEVIIGILEKECKNHHKRFLTFTQKQKPYITLKWAESSDGFIAIESQNEQKPFWISSLEAQQLAHQLRAEEQGILIGTNTALKDNPKLDIRHTGGQNPVRIVLDHRLRLPDNLSIFNKFSQTFIITDIKNKMTSKSLNFQSVTYLFIDFSKLIAEQIVKVLHQKNIQSILIEGGAKTLQTFIDAGLWNEAFVFKSLKPLQKGIKAPVLYANLLKTSFIKNEYLQHFRR